MPYCLSLLKSLLNNTNDLISRTFKVILILNFTIHIFSQKTIPIMRKRFDMTADGCRHIKTRKGGDAVHSTRQNNQRPLC